MGKIHDLGDSWSDIVEKRLYGKDLAISEEDAMQALSIIEDHFPDHIDDVIKDYSTRNIPSLIDQGIAVMHCQDLRGFENVFNRLKRGERPALSELVVATYFKRNGYTPILEPECENKKLDLLINHKGTDIFIEVVSPEKSDANNTTLSLMERLSKELLEGFPDAIIGILLLKQIKEDPHSRSKCNSSDFCWSFVAQAFSGPVVNT